MTRQGGPFWRMPAMLASAAIMVTTVTAALSMPAQALAAPARALAAPARALASQAKTAPPPGKKVVVLPFGSKGWRHKQVRPGAIPHFFKPGFNASHWPKGREGFGTDQGPCPWNTPADVHTPWDVNTDMLVRHRLDLPGDALDVHITGTIDNDAHVYLNGHLLQFVRSGNCAADTIDVTVQHAVLKRHNLLAVRGHDYGLATYLNVQVTYREPSCFAPVVPPVPGAGRSAGSGPHAVTGLDGASHGTIPAAASGAFFYAAAFQVATADGAAGTFVVADPKVGTAGCHSLAELAVESADHRQIVEEGWTVDPGLFGDKLPHLFVYHWVDGNQTCYDGCGFKPTSKLAGSALRVGSIPNFRIEFRQDRWEIFDNRTEVGYFPRDLWRTPFSQAGLTQWFGEVATPTGTTRPCPQMGNGLFASDEHADKIYGMRFIGGPAVSLTQNVTHPSFYSAQATSFTAMRFGGPGACAG
jgi:Neprosin